MTTAYVPGTRMTAEEFEAIEAKKTPAERRLDNWYRQFESDYADRLRANYGIHCNLIKAIKGCNVRELAWELQRAVARRAWQDMPEYPGSATQAKVLHLSFVEWVTESLHTSVDDLMRIMSGQLPDADKAGEAAIAVIDAMQAEDPETLKVLMHSSPDSNLPGWRQLVDGKAKECNGKWTECATHLSDITAGKAGARSGENHWKNKVHNAPGHGALSDSTKQEGKRQPKSERERTRIRFRNLKDNPEKCAELGITTEGAEAAFSAMCNSISIPLAEVKRIAGIKEKPLNRFTVSGSLTPAKIAGRLISFFGRNKAAAIAAAISSALTK